jgi:hypothetical protein
MFGRCWDPEGDGRILQRVDKEKLKCWTLGWGWIFTWEACSIIKLGFLTTGLISIGLRWVIVSINFVRASFFFKKEYNLLRLLNFLAGLVFWYLIVFTDYNILYWCRSWPAERPELSRRVPHFRRLTEELSFFCKTWHDFWTKKKGQSLAGGFHTWL